MFHDSHNPPEREGICDEDGAPLVRREDDEPQTVRRRLTVYHDATEPVIDRYARLGQLLRVDGSSSADEILTEICQALPAAKEQAHGTSGHRQRRANPGRDVRRLLQGRARPRAGQPRDHGRRSSEQQVSPDEVQEVLLGCVLQAGLGQNAARQAAIGAGLPVEVPATTSTCSAAPA